MDKHVYQAKESKPAKKPASKTTKKSNNPRAKKKAKA
jgi:hypothetical protein